MRLYVEWVQQGQVRWEFWWVKQQGRNLTHIPNRAEHIGFANFDLRQHGYPSIETDAEGRLFVDLGEFIDNRTAERVGKQILRLIALHGFAEAIPVHRKASERYLQMLQQRAGLTEADQRVLARELLDFFRPGYAKAPIILHDSLPLAESYWRQHFFQPLLARFSPADATRLNVVTFGLLPTRDANAWTMKVPSGGDLIVIHSEMPRAFLAWEEAQVVMRAKGDASEQAYEFGTRALLESFRPGFLPASDRPRLQLTEQQMMESRVWTFSNIQFVLAHEFAHMLLGHTNRHATVTLANNSEVDIVSRQQDQEFEADRQAFEWLTRIDPFIAMVEPEKWDDFQAKKGLNPEGFGWQPANWIHTLWLLHMVEVFAGVPPESASHPPALARMQHLICSCTNLLSDEESARLRHIVKIGEDLAQSVEQMRSDDS